MHEDIKAPARGRPSITPHRGNDLAKLVDIFVRALEASEAEQRLQKIEEWEARKKKRLGYR